MLLSTFIIHRYAANLTKGFSGVRERFTVLVCDLLNETVCSSAYV